MYYLDVEDEGSHLTLMSFHEQQSIDEVKRNLQIMCIQHRWGGAYVRRLDIAG